MFLYMSLIDDNDRSKFEEIYITYRQTMFYVANKILKDEYLAEDVVHQSFIRIIDNLNKINEINCHKTKGFIVIIVQNIAIDFYRKRKLQYNISFDEFEIYIGGMDSSFHFNEVEEAILKLPINYSTVLRLKYSLGYNNKEISDMLKITEVNVRKRISRGKEKLEKSLSEGGEKSYE